MKKLYFFLLIFTWQTMQAQRLLFDFSNHSNIQNWNIIDDRVMGGISVGTFEVNKNGFGQFSGDVSTANNGGFSSVRFSLEKTSISSSKVLLLKIKGDGKTYQCRIKPDASLYYSYVYAFKTTGEWQIIEIPFSEMYPSFRGRKLEMSNFNHDYLSEIAFLIGNKTNESFCFLIQSISLK